MKVKNIFKICFLFLIFISLSFSAINLFNPEKVVASSCPMTYWQCYYADPKVWTLYGDPTDGCCVQTGEDPNCYIGYCW